MKYAIIGDLHGKELGELEVALSFENPGVLICTGDFDQIKTINQFKDLEQKYKKIGKKVIKVPGNHDHAILCDLEINSGTLKMQGKNIHQLYQELMRDPVAHKYIHELVNPRDPLYTNNNVRIFLDEDKFGKEYPTTVIHGAYDGDLSSFFDCPENIRELWFRLKTESDYKKNFNAMSKKNCKVMVRGHDHDPVYVYDDVYEGVVISMPKENKSVYRLFKYRKHIINPGALFNGLFATIDTKVLGEEVPILKYHKL